MRISDLFQMAFTNLWRRKIRTFLTVLGVIIGCASIIIMMSFGMAQKQQIDEFAGSTAALQSLDVWPTGNYDPRSDDKMPRKGLITDKTIKEIEALPNVESVIAPVGLDPYNFGTEVKIDKYTMMMAGISGFDEDDLEAKDITLKEGRMFNPRSADLEVIASSMAAYMLSPEDGNFENFDPREVELLDKKGIITIGEGAGFGGFQNYMEEAESMVPKGPTKKHRFKIVGIYEDSFMSLGGNSSFITSKENIEKMNDEINEMADIPKMREKIYNNITVNVADKQMMDETQEMIENMDLGASSNAEFIEQMNTFTTVMQAILGGIGGIALLVAAIGITNSMVMSVYERTKEIGVMKVIGAKVSDIRNLFLLEAGMMGLFGGIIGVVFSYAVSASLNLAMQNFVQGMEVGQKVSIITPSLAIGALVVCFIIGLITGYYPAVRATKLSALEAIRTE